MKNTIVVGALFFGAFLDFVFAEEKRNKTINDSSCNQAECLRCDLEAAECVKCLYVIREDSRECLRSCPNGLDPIWSRNPPVFGKMCAERSALSMVSQRQVGIIAGASVLGAICVGIVLGLLLLRKRGMKSPHPDSPPRGLPRSMQDRRPKTEEVFVKGKEREEFLSRLRLLRNDAPCIFRMMAETRNRFKGGSGPENPFETKTKACRAVVRDLSRVLCLLSRKEEQLKTAPKDWDRLLSWTERLLTRYKRQHEIKELESGGVLESPTSPARGHGKPLFLTRQQQEERKRWMERTPSIEKIKKYDEEGFLDIALEFSPDVGLFDFSVEFNENVLDYDESPFDVPDSPPLKIALTPLNSTESLIPKPSPDGKRKKKQHILNLNKSLWSKLIPFKEPTDSGIDVENAMSTCERKKSQDISTVDIPSQTFFDHIEAFVIDLDQEGLEAVNESLRIVTSASKQKKKPVTQSRLMKNILLDNKYKNDIWKNDLQAKRFSLDLNSMSPNKKPSVGKENRVTRIRRLSSSLLRRDKKLVIPKDVNMRLGGKRRRPLQRQKQVEKDQRAAIQEKYQKTSRSDSSSSESPAVRPLPSEDTQQSSGDVTPVNQVIEGGDVYLSVTKTPVLIHRPHNRTSLTHPIDIEERPIAFSFRRHSSTSSGEISSSIPSSPSSTSSPSPTSSSELIHTKGRESITNSLFNFKVKGTQDNFTKSLEPILYDRNLECRNPKTSIARCEILTKV